MPTSEAEAGSRGQDSPANWRLSPNDLASPRAADGRIDALLRLDERLGSDGGGPVLDTAGGLPGMSTAGPRRRAAEDFRRGRLS